MSYKTPCFIIDSRELNENVSKLHKSLNKYWSNYKIGYSVKTNSLPWVVNFFKAQNCYAEVVSDFEYSLAKKIGYSDKEIIFNGPNKGREIFINSLKNNCIVNIDSWREVNWLKEEQFTNNIKLGIRVNLNLEAECPNETSVGQEGSRFGFSLENGDLEKAINLINSLKNVKISGIHLHHTAKTRSLNIYRALAKAACKVKKLVDYDFEYVDIGGGFFGGVPGKPTYDDYMELISTELLKEYSKEKTCLIVEPGSALIASPISFICDVIDVKNTYAKRIVTTNGSRNNIDPFFIKQNYIFEEIFQNESKKQSIVKEQVICGYTCLDNDRIMKIYDGRELSIGDQLLFKKVGAYTIGLTPLFIELFPNVYLKKEDNNYICIREKWGIEEFMQKSNL